MKEHRIICNETAEKEYFYFRNGLLHVKYVVDRAIQLTEDEAAHLKASLTCAKDRCETEREELTEKQLILSERWDELEPRRIVILDGLSEAYRQIEKRKEERKEGKINDRYPY